MDIMPIPEETVLAVKYGANWMDENHPGWAMKIDLESLNMNNCHSCIIGQAVGNYFDEIYKIDGLEYEADDWAIDHGFNAPTDQSYNNEDKELIEFMNLETLWTAEVKKRLG